MRHRARIGLYVLAVVVLAASLMLSAPSDFPAGPGHHAELAAPAAPVRLVGPQAPGFGRPSSAEGVTGSVTASVDLTPMPSGKPPQFVVLSFDGGGSVDLWQYWRAVAARDHAHFTFFMSAPYLLTHATAADYAPPRHRAGASDIGNLPIPAGINPTRYLGQLLEQMRAGYLEGQEVGTHFGGHFCAPGAGNVGTWNAADWSTELDQVSSLLTDVNENNQIDPPVALPFGAGDVVGDRTPCLEGNLRSLYPVLALHGFRYDASQSALEGLWPARQEGIWSFPLASIPLAGRAIHVLSMDYNLYYNQTRARDVPAALEPSIEDQTYNTFMNYFTSAYTSNRAPVVIGAHFTHWNNSAYIKAITRVMDDTCSQPEVRCVSFRDLADWLDAQSPAQLAALHALPVARIPQGASLGSPQSVSPTAIAPEPTPPAPPGPTPAAPPGPRPPAPPGPTLPPPAEPTLLAPAEPPLPAPAEPTPLVQGPVEQ